MRIKNPVAEIIKKIAPTIGAKIILEPVWEMAGQITFKNGRRRYLRASTLDLNHGGASQIARDKDYAKFFLAKTGYPIIAGKVFCSKEWGETIGAPNNGIAAALRFAKKIGWPVIVKPNSQSQGQAVSKVYTRREFESAFRACERLDRMILVENFIAGRDYRVVVLDKKIISAYERVPLSVIGNGKSTIIQLLKRKQTWFKKTGRDTILRLNDIRVQRKLARAGLSLNSKPKSGERVFLLDNANLSSGGDSLDVTAIIHPKFKKLAIGLTKDMGLRLCGVDLMIQGDIAAPPQPGKYWILEINASPGLDHYATIGKIQQKIVENLYLKVLKAMAK